jgi:hypothetical protein
MMGILIVTRTFPFRDIPWITSSYNHSEGKKHDIFIIYLDQKRCVTVTAATAWPVRWKVTCCKCAVRHLP